MAENKYKNYKAKGYGEQKFGSGRKDPWYKNLDPVYLTSLCKDENHIIRFATEPVPFGQHTVYTDPSDMGKKYNERRGKAFFVWCPEFNPDTKEFDHSGHGECDICNKFAKKDLLGRGRIAYFAQGYELEVKRNGRKAWSELKTFVYNGQLCESIQNVMETVGNGIEPSSKKNGYVLHITYKSASPASWFVQKGEDIALKDIDTYSADDFVDIIDMFEPTDPEDITSDLERLGYYDYLESEDDERPAKSGKKSRNDFEDDEEDEKPAKRSSRASFEDDEEDERPAKSGKKSRNDFEDDEEDEKPAKPSKKSEPDDDEDERPAKSGKKPSFDDDEEDERPAKSGKKSRNDFEDDEEDEKPAKPSKKSEPDDEEDERPAKSGKKPSFDDDEEDERPAKSGKKPSFDDDEEDERPAKPSKKSEPDDDDEPAEDEVEARRAKAGGGAKKRLWEDD